MLLDASRSTHAKKKVMMSVCMALVLLFGQPISTPWVDLGEIGLPQPGALSLSQYGNSIYLVGSRTSTALKLGLNGEVQARYDAAGKGPKELDRPSIMGVNEDGVFLLTQQTRIVHLTHDLVPTGRDLPMLPFRSFKGVAVGPDHFRVDATLAPSPAALIDITRDKTTWTQGRHYGDMAPRMAAGFDHMEWNNTENGWVFVYVASLASQNIRRDAYRIKVFHLTESSNNTPAFLESDVSELAEESKNFYVTGVLARKQGFIVALQATSPRQDVTGTWLDTFDTRGRQTGRKMLDTAAALFAVEHSDLDVVFYPDEAVLHFLTLCE